MNELQKATEAIHTYAFGMDTGNWSVATSHFAETVDIDYTAVGMAKEPMSNHQLQEFLQQLLGKQDLRVHTAIAQVLVNPTNAEEFIAYYSVRHYKGQIGQAEKFAVFGWYRFRLQNEKIVALTISVSAMEGNPAMLA